ncbi:hypothetical protein T03_16254 [Trichinella britovi]|uniref:Uncharacterized protein n=1 Tax=Trichinella britovi TaxID=45882 RepID=A0A0V1CHJ5_TRIBR|nr:hypothetical protein T03_16254 [Trichinella britovi]
MFFGMMSNEVVSLVKSFKLTWRGIDCDQEGRNPRGRRIHCTTNGAELCAAPNRGRQPRNFLVWDCVRAIPTFYPLSIHSKQAPTIIKWLEFVLCCSR